jgi:two-component system, cell cycle sensor histidine kinase and response regulator CckA
VAGLGQEKRDSLSGDAGYRMLFEASPLPMWVYDAGTLRFLAVNDAAVRHYGWSRDEFLAMKITEIRPAEEVVALLHGIHQQGSVGSPEPKTWRHQRRDGSLIDVEISAGRIVFEGRDAALVVSRDVTERREMQERLSESEKMEAVGRLAGGVAHDFNNLLTVISGYAAILRADPTASEPLDEIEHAAEQATALTRQLLAFSRRQVLRPQAVDINEIVGGMGPMLERIIGDDVQVTVQLAEPVSAIEADRAQIERVVLNLAANARDAMPRGGRLTIATAEVELEDSYVATHGEVTPGPHVLLSVSDTGTGMSEEVRRRLFEPFFTTKAGGGGTGLGLATVFGVVKQSGGSIFVYSEEGRGTTFKIYLPASDLPVESADDADEPGSERGTETIVVVEDDESVRELVKLMLGGCGYEVLSAPDADAAVNLCEGHPGGVDLLLTDVVMPDIGGRALAERLTALFPHLRVLFMSGYSDEAVFRHGIIREGTAFIEKPFSQAGLARKVREVLDDA